MTVKTILSEAGKRGNKAGAIFLRALTRIIAALDLRDVFVFGGTLLISIGLRSVYPPAALIVPGAMFFWLGIRSVE